MSLNEEKVSQIAYLARLKLSDEELEINTNELNNILQLVEQLQEIEAEGVEPMAHPLHMSQRLRVDEVKEKDDSNNFQSIAPKTGNGHYLVPTVID
ncbi:MAG TPA: Asp-tRNA(Asn)/Glu-tRNA(Gln) amidotransferase GatCAB subunit C [Gammaproteobacteria bacterium]|jgi:aspartyl-tRNA(Asn)/glutamyl-tRNA(Gln) amidotransferase subunit C|nr:Asp-tRNA(Asn)/Glu-tRNA(Gln) amidotransferase subunit GatC [Gammaproteobacteria bacterium]HAY41941.1 Asp-tRNA(Asn)/Glu-tRNA(Gln) amidotransferase GatCAB subunit C [Gammaproteobacteria bacterium]|tara:strand:- start:222 stop:509 length:288 start_codon:yes stop_codon:yes gene_type:complete